MCSAPRPLPTLRGTLLAVGIALALLLSASAASLSALFFRLGVTDISLVRRGSSRCDALLLLTLAMASAPRTLQPHGTESRRAP